MDLYQGLKQSYLDDFDMMLSGYVPGAPALEAVGQIAQELKRKAKAKPGSFFWVLDPVMGDNGNLYVAPDVVPVYKSLVHHADLVLPNQFEAELLSEVEITDMPSIGRAIQVMHERYGIPHIVITSVSLPHPDHPVSSLSVVGSSMTSDRKSRAFKIVFPAIDCYFSGTGDMFAALMVVRMREAVHNSSSKNGSSLPAAPNGDGPGAGAGAGAVLMERESWLSDDGVDALDLPLAKAAEKVLASMHEVLTKTAESMEGTIKKAQAGVAADAVDGPGKGAEGKKMHLLKSKAAELRLVRHLDSLRYPEVEFRATKLTY
ncbi:putative pyridoxal kinase [Collariella sp. IMI 366227]|nr:putative pyridoxal kinase [Collariella sp. IMI 366227]